MLCLCRRTVGIMQGVCAVHTRQGPTGGIGQLHSSLKCRVSDSGSSSVGTGQ